MIKIQKSKIDRPRKTGAHAPVIAVQIISHDSAMLRPSLVGHAASLRQPTTVLHAMRSMHPAWFGVSMLMIVSFMAGMVTVWQTRLSTADADATEPNETGGLVTLLNRNDQNLNVVADLLPILIKENRHEPTLEEIQSKERKDKLRNYLATKKSPLATDEEALDALLSSNNMEMMLAISFVEGNFCKHHVHYNCSGIGGNDMHEYESFAEWIQKFDALLERKYKGLKVEEFIGFYVVPGSKNWELGVHQILDELKEQGIR